MQMIRRRRIRQAYTARKWQILSACFGKPASLRPIEMKKTAPSLRFLITAGGTREYIDPVRFISNASSGRMGYALARAAVRAGHAVTLITAPTA
ncbi:MAG: hypothetical protein KBI46_11245, partial [Phycisphaerae bacterium]|nr:hypothetical protein [Phycisphaerae bacterium]